MVFRVIVEIFQYWYAGNDHVFARIGICFVKYNLHSCILFHFVASFQVYARIIKARSMISILKLFLYFINETHSVDTIHKIFTFSEYFSHVSVKENMIGFIWTTSSVWYVLLDNSHKNLDKMIEPAERYIDSSVYVTYCTIINSLILP